MTEPACPSRGPMIAGERPVCLGVLEHKEPHGAWVDGVYVQWEREVDPELMLLPDPSPSEFDELVDIINRATIVNLNRCKSLAQEILDAGFRQIPRDGTVMIPAPEDGFNW